MIPPSVFRVFRAAKYHRLYLQTFFNGKVGLIFDEWELLHETHAKDRLLIHMLSNTVYNLGHNILELYNVLIQARLNTSKMKRDIWYSKLGIRDLRKYENIRKISNLRGDRA